MIRRIGITTTDIISDFQKVHSITYDYSLVNYKTMHTKVKIVCSLHGEFQQTPNAHIRQKQGCPKCGRINQLRANTSNTNEFILKAKAIHGNKYDYSKTVYNKNAHNKLTLICSNHGEFKITPNSHLSKMAGCDACGRLSGGWTRERYIKTASGRIAYLYLIKCWDNREQFYKIGTTFNSIEHRVGYSSRLPYNYELIDSIESSNAGQIYDLERKLLIKFNKLAYKPLIFFDGFTECFSQPINIKEMYADIH